MRSHGSLKATLLLSFLLAAIPAWGRDIKAVIYLKDPSRVGATIPWVEVHKPRIHGEDRLVLGFDATHDRKSYEKLSRARLDALARLVWVDRGQMLRLTFTDGNNLDCYCYPANSRPPAGGSISVQAMKEALLSGEFVVAGRKVKAQVALQDIVSIQFVERSEAFDYAAFRWAGAENTLASWKEFLRLFPSSPQVGPARDQLAERLGEAAGRAWRSFDAGGPLAEVQRARDLAEELLVLRPGNSLATEIRAKAIAREQRLNDQLGQLRSLIAQQQWELALALHQEVKRFAGELPEIHDLEPSALRGSHDVHRRQGRKALDAGDLEAALASLRTALNRMEDEETRKDLREGEIRLALRDAERALAARQFAQAHALLKGNRTQSGEDARTGKLLEQVSARWADQLLVEARPLYAPLRPVDGPASERKYVQALQRLEQARELSNRSFTESLVAQVRKRLGMYYFNLGKKKRALPGGAGAGQGYLYLQRADGYDASLPGLNSELERAREDFRARSSVGVNVFIQDRSPAGQCGHIAGDIEGSIGAAITNARLANVQVLERLSPEEQLNLPGAAVQVLGDIQVCEAKVRQTDRSIPSRYISGYRENPEFYRLSQLEEMYTAQMNAIDVEDDQYKACEDQERRQGVYGNCTAIRERYRAAYNQARNNLYNVQSALGRTPQQFPEYVQYRYTQRNLNLDGRLRLGYRIVDSLSTARREQQQISEEAHHSGTEIADTMPEDTSGAKDRQANLPSEDAILEEMVGTARTRIVGEVLAFLKSLPQRYLDRARQQESRGALDAAAENYILYLATSGATNSPDKEAARRFLEEKRNLVYRAEFEE